MKQNKILIISGPTAVGKTNLAIKCFEALNCVLISADSMQVYKECNIATAKLSKKELSKYPHELIDIKELTEEFSVKEFVDVADEQIQKAFSRNKLPIIIGGTGFYIETLLYKLSLGNTSKNDAIRKKLEAKIAKNGYDALYADLCKVDPETAQKLSPNDRSRIVRALEIYYATGKKKSEQTDKPTRFANKRYDYELVFINQERTTIYSRIDARVDEMQKNGLVEEAKLIYTKTKANPSSQIGKAIGYRELFDHFENKMSLPDAIQKIKQHSRNYAKRQLTWFRDFPNKTVFEGTDATENALKHILKEFNSFHKP